MDVILGMTVGHHRDTDDRRRPTRTRSPLFWAKVLGYAEDPDDPNEPGHEECMIFSPDGRDPGPVHRGAGARSR